jgi:DeoR/GlpR family transcriptional regulator of sugar metabolism
MHVSAHLPEQRREAILRRLTQGEPVAAAALARQFGVSEDAIRRDLREMAAAGLCKRVYGGALPLSPAGAPIGVRATQATDRKAALARAALGLIRDGATLVIDTGSTNAALAALLPEGRGLRVITNSLAAATAVMARPGIELYLIGGRVDPQLGGVTGARAVVELRQFRADLCFLGSCAVSSAFGVAGFDTDDADFKIAALAASAAAATLATNDKLDTVAPHLIAPLAGLNHLVVEHDAPPAIVAALAAAGPSIITATP